MTIEQERTGKTTVTLILNGRLDTANAPLLEQKIKQWGNDITEIILDFAQLEYISSMGLRVLLQAKKEMKQTARKLTIKNMNASVKEVFEMTGFLNLMVQEEKFVVIRRHEVADSGGHAETIILSINGEMQHENVEVVSKELVEIKEANSPTPKMVAVILDMERLAVTSAEAVRLLRQAVKDTEWEHRAIKIQNASPVIQAILENEGLGYLL